MCLKIDFEKTKQWKKTFGGYKGFIQMWKYFDTRWGNRYGPSHEGLYGPYQHNRVQVGWNTSNRSGRTLLTDDEKTIGAVCFGCHVIVNPVAYDHADRTKYDEDIMVPVYVKACDFVAMGTFDDNPNMESAVFTKYLLRKSDYNAAMAHKGIGMTDLYRNG